MELLDYERQHGEALRQLGAECAVLLRRNGDFPLEAPCEIALYGSGARRTVKGGTGSGEVNSHYFVTVEDGLESAGFRISTKYWLDTYDALYQAARRDFLQKLRREAHQKRRLAVLESMGAIMPEPEYTIPLIGQGNTAVYVLSRISGEGSDRKPVPGDLLLSGTEIRDILALRKKYPKFLLVLNVGGVVDLSPIAEVENILLLSQLGAETGNILADLLLGRASPSGKLSATWAAWGAYPDKGDFGLRDETRYREGIYVGYRYFDTVGKVPLFPFGFGLSYTDFSVKAAGFRLEGETVKVTAKVENTGIRPGKETVQLYASAPAGRLDQPYQTLAAFSKTRELQPGEWEALTLSFRIRDLASYDEKKSAWVLEKGRYLLRLGVSSADTKPVGVLRLDREAVCRQCRPCCGKPDFADWKPEPREQEKVRFLRTLHFSPELLPTETVNYQREETPDERTKGFSNEELILLNIGAFDPRGGIRSIIGNAGKTVAGAAGETTGALKAKGVPVLVMADGPAGLRLSREYSVDEKGVHALGEALPESVLELLPRPVARLLRRKNGGAPKGERHFQYASALPIGTALAQSWNTNLAEICGDLVGDEMERFGVQIWLAPALNLQRDIRCGRNFEYFSEDPLLSGKMAAAITRGVQKHPGRSVTLKHFAANNQEYNRYNNNSLVSQRALRELYLRGFEIAVREGRPHALMSSYNLLNGVHTSQRRDLIEDVLRCEFGYQGIVMTDWIIGAMQGRSKKYPAPDAGKIAASGHELVMPGCKGDRKAMLRALKKKKLSRRQLQLNAGRLLRLADLCQTSADKEKE